MSTYAYTARDGAGKLIEGKTRAQDEATLRKELRSEGILLVRAKRVQVSKRSSFGRRITSKDLIMFTFSLQNVLESAVPLLTGLQDMHAESKDGPMKAVTEDLIESILGGETFSQALRHHPNVFSDMYVSMCEGGEETGRLPHVMGRLVEHLEWREDFRRQIREVVTYPVVILVALVGLIGLMVGFVFPRFASVFERVNFELPWSTKMLLAASEFSQNYWYLILIGGASLWIGAVLIQKITAVRFARDSMALKLPIVGELILMLNSGQVANSLSAFLDSGIPITRALELIERMLDNLKFSKSIKLARESIEAGKTVSEAIKATGVFPPLIQRVVSMGEQTGNLVQSMDKAAQIYDRELPQKTKRVLELMNPILTALMGGMLFFVIISLMLPLYKMYQEIGAKY